MKYFATVGAKVEHFGQLNLYLRYNESLISSVITKNYISLWHQRPKGKLYYRNAFLAQYLLSLLTPSSTDCQKSSPTQQKVFFKFKFYLLLGSFLEGVRKCYEGLEKPFVMFFKLLQSCIKAFWTWLRSYYPASNHMLKANNRNTKTWCEISSKLTIMTPRHHWHRTSVFIVNFEQANVGWVLSIFKQLSFLYEMC